MPTRKTLPSRRFSCTYEVAHASTHGQTNFRVSIGYFEDNLAPAEVFISGTKAGSDVEAVTRDGAVLMSIALQYGAPMDVLRGAVTRDANGKPLSIIGTVVDELVKPYLGEQE